MVVKTFRGLLLDGGQDRIRLSTIKGKVGYRIIKLQIIRESQTASIDHVVKVLREEDASVPAAGAKINLSDNKLLAVAAISGTAQGEIYTTIIFDREIFNQDIFVTHTDNDGNDACNYYVELEVIPLDDAGAEYTTLKDMRS